MPSPRYIATSHTVITKSALSINERRPSLTSMNEHAEKEERKSAWSRYDVTKYTFLQRTISR